jgi:general secretion pathway protein L
MVIICFLVADMGTDYYLLKNRYKTLEKKIEEVFRKTLPDVRRIVDPVQQLKVKINEIKKVALPGPGLHSREKVLDLLNDISVRIPASLNLQMTRLVIDQEKVSISGTTDSFNTVDSIKSGLEPSGYFGNVAIASANLDRTGKQVKFEIKLQRKNP